MLEGIFYKSDQDERRNRLFPVIYISSKIHINIIFITDTLKINIAF